MDIKRINARIDAALQSNVRSERLVIALSTAMFLLGVGIVLAGYYERNVYLMSGAVLVNAFLVWPILRILKIRRENVALQAAPTLISSLPPERAAQEIVKLLKFIRGEQDARR